MSSLANKTLHLYTAPLSGCSARIRIAAHLKSIPLTYHTINFSTNEQQNPSYLSINPNGRVPTLVISSQDSSHKTIITQSPAILDFLSHHFPTPSLLPDHQRFEERARVLELASLVACDIQPPQNSRIRREIKERYGGDGVEWARGVYERGFGVYERFLERRRMEDGKEERYSVGDEITLADVFLVPAAQGGLRVGVKLSKWPLVKGVVGECWRLEAFRKGGLGGHGKLVP